MKGVKPVNRGSRAQSKSHLNKGGQRSRETARADTPVRALYCCDGRRTLAEIIRLTRLEVGSANFDFVKYFRLLEKKGYVEFTGR